jgi:hypothetical protein
MMEMRNAYKILVAKPKGKRQLGRLRWRYKYIRMDFRETLREFVVWIHLPRDRSVAGPCEHGNEPLGE